jgi:hypothetical protein
MTHSPQDEELLEPVALQRTVASGGVAKGRPAASVLLMLLLGLWALAVYAFFSRKDVAVELPLEAGATAQPVATATPTPLPTAIPTAVPPALRIESQPPGASVLRNGRFVGVTPLLLSDPRAGEPLQLTLSGHAPKMLVLQPQEMAPTLRVELEQQMGTIRVILDPPGATFYLNGEQREIPPDGRLLLPQREQVLRAEAPGHRTREMRVTPAAAYERNVELRLTAESP